MNRLPVCFRAICDDVVNNVFLVEIIKLSCDGIVLLFAREWNCNFIKMNSECKQDA